MTKAEGGQRRQTFRLLTAEHRQANAAGGFRFTYRVQHAGEIRDRLLHGGKFSRRGKCTADYIAFFGPAFGKRDFQLYKRAKPFDFRVQLRYSAAGDGDSALYLEGALRRFFCRTEPFFFKLLRSQRFRIVKERILRRVGLIEKSDCRAERGNLFVQSRKLARNVVFRKLCRADNFLRRNKFRQKLLLRRRSFFVRLNRRGDLFDAGAFEPLEALSERLSAEVESTTAESFFILLTAIFR